MLKRVVQMVMMKGYKSVGRWGMQWVDQMAVYLGVKWVEKRALKLVEESVENLVKMMDAQMVEMLGSLRGK